MSPMPVMRQGEWGPAVPVGSFPTPCLVSRAHLQADGRASCTSSICCSQDSCPARSCSLSSLQSAGSLWDCTAVT